MLTFRASLSELLQPTTNRDSFDGGVGCVKAFGCVRWDVYSCVFDRCVTCVLSFDSFDASGHSVSRHGAQEQKDSEEE